MYCSNKNLKESIWFLRIFFLKNGICVLKIILDLLLNNSWTSLVAQTLKRLPAMWETWVQSLGREDPLEKEMATHSITLAWRIPWMKEPARLQSTGWQRVRHDWATSLSLSFSSLSVLNTMSITAQRGEKEIGQPETGKSYICFGHLPKATWILGLYLDSILQTTNNPKEHLQCMTAAWREEGRKWELPISVNFSSQLTSGFSTALTHILSLRIAHMLKF